MATHDQLECGRLARRAFGELQREEWGPYHANGNIMIFKPQNEFIFVVTLYASVDQAGLWWFGCKRNDWASWSKRHYLAFLMKDEDGINSVLLDPQESQRLLGLHDPKSNGEKKLHIRRPKNMGSINFDKWKEFPLSTKLRRLKV